MIWLTIVLVLIAGWIGHIVTYVCFKTHKMRVCHECKTMGRLGFLIEE